MLSICLDLLVVVRYTQLTLITLTMQIVRKALSTFLLLFAAESIDEQEKTCISFLIERRGILQTKSDLQRVMYNRLVRQYAAFNALSDTMAVTQLMTKAGCSKSEIEEALSSLKSQSLIKS
jgi:hypothetical protein